MAQLSRTFKTWLFVTPRSQLIDVIGPLEVLRYATDLSDRGGYELHVVSAEHRSVTFSGGLEMTIHGTLDEVVREGLPHTIIVGGGGTRIEEGVAEWTFASWLSEHERFIPRVTSVCSGAFTLAAAGLLDGRQATTHWLLVPRLAREYPAAHIVNEGIYVRAGKVWTAAGMSAGIDMALALVANDLGHDIALEVAQLMVLYLHRHGGQRQFSRLLQADRDGALLAQRARDTVLAHIGAPISVDALAHSLGVSPRTLSRRLKEEVGRAPGGFIRLVKLTEAQRLLVQTALPIAAIGEAVGIGGEGTFRRAFRVEFGTNPRDYRVRFGMLRPRVLREQGSGCGAGEEPS